jgi:hypothetical protein
VSPNESEEGAVDRADWITCRVTFFLSPSGATVGVFPINANAYSGTIADFLVRPDQELPSAEPGAAAMARPDFREIEVGGVIVRPRGAVHTNNNVGRISAEKGQVLARPGHEGPRSAWPEPAPVGERTLAEQEEALRKGVRNFILTVVLFLAAVAFTIAVWANTDRHPVRGIVITAAAMVVAIREFVRVVRSKKSIAAARRTSDQPGRSMLMRLWWAAGYGAGPIAVASLWTSAEPDTVVDLEVVGVPNGFDPPMGTEVVVRGEFTSEGGVTIQLGSTTLWSSGLFANHSEV